MKKILSILILACIILSCTESPNLVNEEKISSFTLDKDNLKTFESSALQKDSVFSQISEFPVIKDSAQFITNLRQIFKLEVDESSYQKENERITSYEKVQLYGSDNDYILIEYDYRDGCGAAFPWKYQLLLNTDGKPLESLSALRFEFIEIFKNQPPLLLTVDATSKGNGGHSIFKISADTLENILDNDLPYYLRTYDAHHDNRVNEPYELVYNVIDWNNDGINDISFNGKFVLIQGLSEYGDWYDGETINGKEITYSEENPFKKVDVELVFLFNKNTNHFKVKEVYSKEYEIYK